MTGTQSKCFFALRTVCCPTTCFRSMGIVITLYVREVQFDQYAHGVTRSHKTYGEIYQIQRPERLAKFDVYIHMNCDAKVAWERVAEDEGKDRYEYPEYFERQVENTKKLYQDIIKGIVKELGFLNSAKHVYIDTTNLTIQQTFEKAMKEIEDIL